MERDGQSRRNRGVLEQTERGEEGGGSEGSGKMRERMTQKGKQRRGKEQRTEWRQREIRTGHGGKESEMGVRERKKETEVVFSFET